MNSKPDAPRTPAKIPNRPRRKWLLLKSAVFGFSLLVTLLIGRWVWAQTAPGLTIARTGTNQFLITVTNGLSTGNYELWTTPVLGNPVDYPWTGAAVGSPGQTNFTVPTGLYPAGFFQVILDTNAIPLWEAADPHNPSAGILTVFIDSPTNGAVIQ